MDPMTIAALVGGAATIGSTFLGSRSSEKGAAAANAANLASVQQQIAFQREAMQNRHQWEVSDLRAAGLNPILSAGGQPPVPSGASTTFQNEKAGRGELAVAMASAMTQLQNARADIRLKSEMAKTEISKQELQNAQASAARGVISIPGVGTVPIDRAADAIQALKNSKASTVAQNDHKPVQYAVDYWKKKFKR